MSQNDFGISNQTAPNFRADLNLALQALASTSSGATAPSTTYANMLWYDTANNILKMRTEADDAWIELGTLDQSTNTFTPAGQVAVLDEDDFASDSATRPPSQQSTKAYIPTALNASGSAPIYACRAWGNLNGTGTPALRASGNVASVTDNGTGDYTITFTTAMEDANYAVNVTATDVSGNAFIGTAESLSAGSFVLKVRNTNNVPQDGLIILFSVFR